MPQTPIILTCIVQTCRTSLLELLVFCYAMNSSFHVQGIPRAVSCLPSCLESACLGMPCDIDEVMSPYSTDSTYCKQMCSTSTTGKNIWEGCLTCDHKTTNWSAYVTCLQGCPSFSHLTLTGGAIGSGPPLAVGAAIACPHRCVINLQVHSKPHALDLADP